MVIDDIANMRRAAIAARRKYQRAGAEPTYLAVRQLLKSTPESGRS